MIFNGRITYAGDEPDTYTVELALRAFEQTARLKEAGGLPRLEKTYVLTTDGLTVRVNIMEHTQQIHIINPVGGEGAPTRQLVKEKVYPDSLRGGFVFRDTANEETILSPFTDGSGYVVRQREQGASPFVAIGGMRPYASILPSGVEFGNMDWQGVLGERYVLTWGSKTNQNARHSDRAIAAGSKIYRGGIEYAELPGSQGSVMGVAISSDRKTLIAIQWDTFSNKLVAYERAWSENPYSYNEMKDADHPEGWVEVDQLTPPTWGSSDRFNPTSVFAFNASGTEGCTILTGLTDKSAFAEVEYVKGVGFSASYGKAGRVATTDSFSLDSTETPALIPYTQSGLLEAEATYMTREETTGSYTAWPGSNAPFSVLSDIPVAVDYVGDEKQRLHYIFQAPSLQISAQADTTTTFKVQATYNGPPSFSYTYSGHEATAEVVVSGSGAIIYSYHLAINNTVIILDAVSATAYPPTGTFNGTKGAPVPGEPYDFDMSGSVVTQAATENSIQIAMVDLRRGIVGYTRYAGGTDYAVHTLNKWDRTVARFGGFTETLHLRNVPYPAFMFGGYSLDNTSTSTNSDQWVAADWSANAVDGVEARSIANEVELAGRSFVIGVGAGFGVNVPPMVEPVSTSLVDVSFVKVYVPENKIFVGVKHDSQYEREDFFYLQDATYAMVFEAPPESAFWDFLNWDDISVV